ncbi:MAG: radical SAM protein [Proteobacteria bacterium]|nr:radical SAM protein [Pseudomonadota bacterium]
MARLTIVNNNDSPNYLNSLGQTKSVCSTCLKEISANIILEEGKIFLQKFCEEHGAEKVLESSSQDFYFYQPTPTGSCCGGGSCCETSTQKEPLGPTCVALIEITDSCNLECPVCFASSSPKNRYLMSIQEFIDRVEGTIKKKGVIDILMLSGGEPLVHPELVKFLAYLDNQPQIKRCFINTNGILIAKSEKTRKLLEQYSQKVEVYLQFDSLKTESLDRYRAEENLIQDKVRAVSYLEELKIPTTLAAVVTKQTTSEEISKLVEFCFQYQKVRGITFQPLFASGRNHLDYNLEERITTPDVVKLVSEAIAQFTPSSFVNLPCSHPNCAIVSYFYRAAGKIWPITENLELSEDLKNRINYNLEDLKKCGCDNTDLGNFIQASELSADNSFRIVIKPFMDRFSLNRHRSAQCCTHVVGPESELMSFCEYNIFRENLSWNR